MKYILEGNDKELERVIKENRVRVNRGLISIIPISECGEIGDHNTKMQELVSSVEEKDALISTLKGQCDGLKARIIELENTGLVTGDDKGLSGSDSKVLAGSDTKELEMKDKKDNLSEEAKPNIATANESAFIDDPKF